jgi:hypothetical protein
MRANPEPAYPWWHWTNMWISLNNRHCDCKYLICNDFACDDEFLGSLARSCLRPLDNPGDNFGKRCMAVLVPDLQCPDLQCPIFRQLLRFFYYYFDSYLRFPDKR